MEARWRDDAEEAIEVVDKLLTSNCSDINQMSHGILLPSPMSKPFVQLPFELWSHIATFFTIEEMERTKLYALNRSLLALYLRERYKILHLMFVSGSAYSTRSNCVILSRRLNHIK
jgi:hypothetical protein